MPADEQLNRTILPIPEPKHVGLTTYDAKDPDTRYPPIRALRPPGAAGPNGQGQQQGGHGACAAAGQAYL